MKRILVIEDDQKHRQDAKKFFESKRNIELTYASNYNDAKRVMFNPWKEIKVKGNIDGVISDIYFPLSSEHQWNQPEPIGVRVAVELSQIGMPFVLNTAGYHHGRKYQWIYTFAGDQGWTLIDASDDYERDADSKNWKEAYESLEMKMKCEKNGK